MSERYLYRFVEKKGLIIFSTHVLKFEAHKLFGHIGSRNIYNYNKLTHIYPICNPFPNVQSDVSPLKHGLHNCHQNLIDYCGYYTSIIGNMFINRYKKSAFTSTLMDFEKIIKYTHRNRKHYVVIALEIYNYYLLLNLPMDLGNMWRAG